LLFFLLAALQQQEIDFATLPPTVTTSAVESIVGWFSFVSVVMGIE